MAFCYSCQFSLSKTSALLPPPPSPSHFPPTHYQSGDTCSSAAAHVNLFHPFPPSSTPKLVYASSQQPLQRSTYLTPHSTFSKLQLLFPSSQPYQHLPPQQSHPASTMHLTTTTTTTTTLSLLDLALANPIASITRENPSGVPTPMPPQLVSMDLYPGAHCSPGTANATLALADTACHALNSAKGLRVVHFDEKKLRYNARKSKLICSRFGEMGTGCS